MFLFIKDDIQRDTYILATRAQETLISCISSVHAVTKVTKCLSLISDFSLVNDYFIFTFSTNSGLPS